MDVETEIEDIDGLIAAEQEIDLYRVVQEGVNNIMKHAEAKKAEVRIRRMNGSIIVTLQDDGRGFDIRALREKSESLGLGLQGIAERVRILGGSLDLESVPGSGTMVRAAIPVRKMMHTRNETSRSDT
jgi:signal transduction histidine kinase